MRTKNWIKSQVERLLNTGIVKIHQVSLQKIILKSNVMTVGTVGGPSP